MLIVTKQESETDLAEAAKQIIVALNKAMHSVRDIYSVYGPVPTKPHNPDTGKEVMNYVDHFPVNYLTT